MNNTLQILENSGSGRSHILLFEQGEYESLAYDVYRALSKLSRVLLIKSPRITQGLEVTFTERLRSLLVDQQIRQASFIGFGPACILVESLSLLELKLVRSIVFVDAATRAHPSLLTKIIDKIEETLPLGLPLRLRDDDFDGKPFLQRIRCPTLVVTTSKATQYMVAEGDVLVSKLPTAWRGKLERVSEEEANKEVDNLNALILDFQKVQAKCPQ